MSTLDAPLSFSADGGRVSIGMIVGVPVCIIFVLTGGIIIAVRFVRKLNMTTDGDEFSHPGGSTLRIDLADDGLDATQDLTVTTLVDTLTGDLASTIPTFTGTLHHGDKDISVDLFQFSD
jgi:hypothetical protein